MHHFFVEKGQVGSEYITITGADVNHIKNVLRMKQGEEILVSNKEDKDYLCVILEMGQESVTAEIIEAREGTTELPSKIYLFQGLPKSDKMELIIQKAVELGVYEIIPVATKRAVVKLDAKKEESKLKRWQGISESAAKQSKRMVIPRVAGVMSFKEAVAYASGLDSSIIPYEHAEGMRHTKDTIAKMAPGTGIGVFIGPEGGFDDSEIELALANNIIPVTLGKRILRTETAGLTALSVIMFQLEND